VPWWVHTAVGIVVVGALTAAAWRTAGRVAPRDRVLRLLAAVVLWWLGAELAGLATRLPLPGGTPVLGSAAALALAAIAVVPWGRGTRGAGSGRPDGPAPGADPVEPAAAAMLVGVGAGLVVLVAVTLARPVVGFDGLLYHLALPAAWVPQDELAGLPHVVPGLPVEAYPVGMEVVLGWLVAVTGSTATAVLLSPLALATLVVSVWTAARRLGTPVLAAWGAVASVALSLPALVDAGQVHSDVLSTALMACGVALALAGAERLRAPGAPPASGDALLLGACAVLLAVGVKTTAACGVVVVLLLAIPHRRVLAARIASRRAWVAPLVLALACGAAWALRNVVLHGHPSWPLLATSFGDPVPPLLATVDGRFADDPLGVLDAGGGAHLRLAWIVVPLLLAGLATLVRARGPRRALAACGVLGALAWTVAPATGITTDPDLAAGAVRYLLPCWTLLALAAWSWPPTGRARRLVPALAPVVLLAQLGLALEQAARQGTALHALPLRAVLVGVAAGAVAWGVAASSPGRVAAAARVRGAPVLIALAVAAAVLVATPGFWERHADVQGEVVPPVPSRPVVALGGTPAWSLGPHGRPGSVLAGDCAAVLREHAAGRTVAVSSSGAAGRCAVPGAPAVVDGFRVWGPVTPGR
jgi:hypothetical protein